MSLIKSMNDFLDRTVLMRQAGLKVPGVYGPSKKNGQLMECPPWNNVSMGKTRFSFFHFAENNSSNTPCIASRKGTATMRSASG